ncbi:MAG: carbonate dehydratase [Betaproteobacteria bacterium]|nr:carbonate dehydratase [Betaproteobacteria bacterium]MBU6513654.1 carbonate dehydratase [Betaproteobacteria bacterium]MDE1955266.1 carbonate dehydratase [Betaproteobacteria bacterium]MDE2153209.1 carbonate dehydratase [Betaproteobacteria bacterium]MDE2478234.1 carbonate dehydratase [Betaproteobacteria bacterium]
MPQEFDPDYAALFDNNRRWVRRVNDTRPDFFPTLARQQAPKYFWIGCADSRVPANEVIDLAPGEVFVHRNVANVMPHSDMNSLSTLQFAVDVLRVEHILVVGHYGCGGVKAALDGARVGLVDNWLGHVGDVIERHAARLAALPAEQRWDRLCELNALEQAHNVCRTTVLQDAWARGQHVEVHACCYGLKDGLLRDLGLAVRGGQALAERFVSALAFVDHGTRGAIR